MSRRARSAVPGLLLVLLASGAAVSAAGTGAPPPADREMLTLNERPILPLAPIRDYPASRRVQGIRERYDLILRNGEPGPVTTSRGEEGILVKIGEEGLFFVRPADLDPESGETLEQAAARAVAALEGALALEREARDVKIWVRGTVFCVLALLALWLAVRLLIRLRRRVQALAASHIERRHAWFKEHGLAISRYEQLITGVLRLIHLVSWLTALTLAYLYIAFCLRQFPQTRAWGETLHTGVLTGVSYLGLGLLRALPGLLVAAIILAFTWVLTRVVRWLFDAVETGRIETAPAFRETVQPTRRMVSILLWVFALVLVYPYLPGSESPAFKGATVFLGLLVSLGSSGVVGQVMSGFTLMYSRSLKAGDYVRVGDHEGTVLSLGLLSTKIRTIKREEVTIPNALMVGNVTMNYTRSAGGEGVLLYTSVTIGYDAPWRQVHAMLLEAARRTEGLASDPAPFVLQRALNDFYVDYQVNARLEDPARRIPVLSELHAHIQDCFNENGVQIMSPHYRGDPQDKKWVPRERWHEPPAEPPGKG
jgi:small-conductance mechanosensitive channel